MIVYKLFRLRKDNSLGPLFINAKQRIPVGEWLEAESHPTKGYALRPGWHVCLVPYAPHLKKEPRGVKRVWVMCEAEGVESYPRPESQGGMWILAKKLKVLEVLG